MRDAGPNAPFMVIVWLQDAVCQRRADMTIVAIDLRKYLEFRKRTVIIHQSRGVTVAHDHQCSIQ